MGDEPELPRWALSVIKRVLLGLSGVLVFGFQALTVMAQGPSLVTELRSHQVCCVAKKNKIKFYFWMFPGGPVVRILSFHCRVCRFTP